MSDVIMSPEKIEEFRGYSDGTDDFIKELFEQYFETSNQLLSSIKITYENEDDKQLLADIHTLKGSTRNMGLDKFGEFIINWEKKLKAGDRDNFTEDYKTAQELYSEIKKFQQSNFPF